MDVQPQTDLKAYADRLEVLCRAQADEITRLRAQVAALTEGTDDAHSVLRRLYLDETQPSTTRVRAAQAALNVEKASLKPVSQLELTAEPEPMPLAEVVRLQRARCDKMLREDPQFQALRDSGYLLEGNGSAGNSGDDSSSNDHS
jgi:hypothetical protein